MAFFSPFRPLLRGWLFSFAGWGLVAAVFGLDHFLDGRGTWLSSLWESLCHWLPWALLTPLLFRLVSRLPLDRRHWRLALPTHLLCCLAVILGVHWWRQTSAGNGGHAGLLHEPPHGGPPWDRREGDRPPPPPPPEGGEDGPPDQHRPGPHGFLTPRFFGGLELPLYLMLLSAAHAVFFFRRDQERAASLAQARLEALRLQLQPHFLFNTLNAIAGLVHEEPDRADALLTSLSELLRLTLATSTERELPLAREMEFVQRYLDIMRARFEEKLECVVEIAPETLEAMVPSFLLHPLVEGAVQHALDLHRRTARVSIRATRDAGTLRLRVADNGVALPEGEPGSEGLRVHNARAQLRALYGARASLSVDRAEGCIVEIALPFHSRPTLP